MKYSESKKIKYTWFFSRVTLHHCSSTTLVLSVKDFSYILRSDITITEIDEYTKRLKSELVLADESLKKDIESQLKALSDKKSELEKVESIKDSKDNTTNE